MTYFLIRNKITGKYVRKTQYNYDYVYSADSATLMTTLTGATLRVQRLDKYKIAPGYSQYRHRRKASYKGDHEVIAVNILIYPVGVQPFIDGVLNGNTK